MLDTQLVAFLEGKSPDEAYEYQNSNCCAAAQFNRSIGRAYPVSDAIADRRHKKTFDGRLESISFESPRTFGFMLDRARREFA